MSWIAVAGVAVTAVGAGMAASGAAKSAAAIGAANDANATDEQALYDRQQKAANQLASSKENKLSNLGNIFDRMQSTGAFGDTNTLKNLRKAQEDYSALAAGDFSGFESQLRQSLSDSLIATAGSGAPIGTFAGLAAQDQLALRGQGINTAMGISEYLSKESYNLLGNEFGIMDQKFEVGYKLDRDKTSNMNNYRLGQAATEGVALSAYGNATQQVGSSVIGAYNNYQNMQTVRASNANQLKIAEMAYGSRTNPYANPNMMMGGSGGAVGAGLYGGGSYPSPLGYRSGIVNASTSDTDIPPPLNGEVVDLGDFPGVDTNAGPGVLPPLGWQNPSPYRIPTYNQTNFDNPNPGYYQANTGFGLLASIGAGYASR